MAEMNWRKLKHFDSDNKILWPALGQHTFWRQLSSKTQPLTSAVGETVVAGGAASALAADDVWPTGALAAHRFTGGARGAGLVAVAGQRPVVIQCHQGASGVTAEL